MSASDYAMQGWSVSELSAQGGWKSLSQLKRYTQIKGEHLAQKMRRLRCLSSGSQWELSS